MTTGIKSIQKDQPSLRHLNFAFCSEKLWKYRFSLSVKNLTSNVTEGGKSTEGTSVWGDVSSGNQLSPRRVFEN